MDPRLLVFGALEVGARTGVGEATRTTLTDTYLRLKQRVASEFAGNRAAEVVLVKYEADPEAWAAPLAKALEDSGATHDTEVQGLARQFLDLADPSGAEVAKYINTNVTQSGEFHTSIGGKISGDIVGADLPAGGGAGNSPGVPVADDD